MLAIEERDINTIKIIKTWLDKNDEEFQSYIKEKHRLHNTQSNDTSSVSKKVDTVIFVR